MRVFELRRVCDTLNGTFGVLLHMRIPFCVTLEPPALGNASDVSSIPEGRYYCKRYSSEKFPNTFEVMNVKDRSNILFHAGNVVKDTAGCILLGASFWKFQNNPGISNSGMTFERFLSLTSKDEEFLLIIYDV